MTEYVTTAWTPERVQAFKAAFFNFLEHVKIISKELEGQQAITLYSSQRRFLDAVFDGLSKDIRFFVILKARQLGLSTISYLLTVFYVSVFPGIQGAIVFDKEKTRDKFRELIKLAFASLPESHSIEADANNRSLMKFPNGSILDFLIAGSKKSRTSADIGRGGGYNFVHGTEVSSWPDSEGLESLERTLAEKHPYRLFIFESTAKSFNMFFEMWRKAKADDLAKCAVFIGWWAKEDYAYPEGSPLYLRYTADPVSKEEQERIDEVYTRYGHRVTLEQLAWYRHQSDPSRDKTDEEIEDDGIFAQEVCWTEDEAFILSGSQFFPTITLSKMAAAAAEKEFLGFRYELGNDFFALDRQQVKSAREATLKIWERPHPNGIYVIGGDPAYASNPQSDRYVAQILRVYADGVDQVGEYAERNIETHHFAWILLDLCGMFQNARFLLEINGPGEAVWQAMCEMKMAITMGYMKHTAEVAGLRNIYANVRNYIWTRPDAVTRGTMSYHFKTNATRKFSIMTNLKSGMISGEVNVASIDCLEECRHIVQQGTAIGAEGRRKDDRVMALALAVQAWHDSERKRLIAQGLTRDLAKRASMSPEEVMRAFSGDMFRRVMKHKAIEQQELKRALNNGSRWRW